MEGILVGAAVVMGAPGVMGFTTLTPGTGFVTAGGLAGFSVIVSFSSIGEPQDMQ